MSETGKEEGLVSNSLGVDKDLNIRATACNVEFLHRGLFRRGLPVPAN